MEAVLVGSFLLGCFFFQAEDGIRDDLVTGVQTCALPIYFGRDLTEASDLYSLGVTLICLLTGTRSVDVGKLINDEYRFDFKSLPSNIHPQFIEWLRSMVEPNIKNRFANAAVALEALIQIPVILKPKSTEGNILVQSLALLVLFWVGIAGTQGMQKNSVSQVYQQDIVEYQREKIDNLQHRVEQLEKKQSRTNRLLNLFVKNRQQVISLDRLRKDKECNGCDLEKANLDNVQLNNVSLKRAKLVHTNLNNKNLQSSNLEGANLHAARLEDAKLNNANLSNANLAHANLNYADLRGADLRNAKLRFTRFYGADLRGANLEFADLDGIDFSNTKLKGAIMPGGKIHP